MVESQDPKFDNRPMMIPVIIPRSDYDLVCRKYKTGHRQWIVRPRLGIFNVASLEKDNGDESYHVFFMDFCMPNLTTGKHNSIVSPSKKHSQYVSQLYEFLVEAHKQRSHPPVCLEQVPTASVMNPINVMSLPNSSVLRAQDEAHQERTVMAINEQLVVNSLQQAMTEKRGAEYILTDAHDSEFNVKRFKPTIVDNQHYIPSGYKIGGQPPLPEAQQDLLNYSSDLKEHILSLHGIPASIVLSGARNNSKTTTNMIDDNDFVCFQRTLRLDAHMLCRLATDMYLSTLPILNRRSDLKFTLRMIPFASPAAIHRMFDSGIIKGKSRNHTVLALNGMDEADEADSPEDIVRPPQNGNENQITSLVKSKERVQLAEAMEREANAKAKLAELEGKTSEIKGQERILELQIKLEEIKIKGQLEILQKKIEAERAKPKSTSSS
jgi:hypothetical protein